MESVIKKYCNEQIRDRDVKSNHAIAIRKKLSKKISRNSRIG
jgi:hypothetical protein